MTSTRRNGPYAPLSATYASDDAIIEAGEAAELLFVRALAFCATSNSDGYVTRAQLIRHVGAGMDDTLDRAARLVEVGLWEQLDGGWQINAWLKWNKSAEELGRHRAKDRERKRARNGDGTPPTPPRGFHMDSARNPDGIPMDSGGSPNGLHEDSAASRAEARTRPRVGARTPAHGGAHAPAQARHFTSRHVTPPPTPSVDEPGDTSELGPRHDGGGENRDLDLDQDVEVTAVAESVADAWRRPAAALAGQTGAIRTALNAGWPAPALAEHLAADPPEAMRKPAAILAKRLAVLPTGPAACDCRGCASWRRSTAPPTPIRRPACPIHGQPLMASGECVGCAADRKAVAG